MKYNKELTYRLIFLFIGIFIVAINYNFILSTENIVTGGVSGLALIARDLFGLNRVLTLNILTVFLFVIGVIFLDFKTALKSLFGALSFNVLVYLTNPLALNFNFDNYIVTIILASIFVGTGFGLIYKTGFNTGGSDILVTIISRKFNVPMGKASTFINAIVITSGFFVFGASKSIIGLIILTFGNKIADIILLGVQDSKILFIKTDNEIEIKKYLIEKAEVGITEIKTKGGLIKKEKPIFFVVVPLHKYQNIKNGILNIDGNAFIQVKNSYNVTGGYKKGLIPF